MPERDPNSQGSARRIPGVKWLFLFRNHGAIASRLLFPRLSHPFVLAAVESSPIFLVPPLQLFCSPAHLSLGRGSYSPTSISTTPSPLSSTPLEDFSYHREDKETVTLSKTFPLQPLLFSATVPASPHSLRSQRASHPFSMPLWWPAPVWRFLSPSLGPQGQKCGSKCSQEEHLGDGPNQRGGGKVETCEKEAGLLTAVLKAWTVARLA